MVPISVLRPHLSCIGRTMPIPRPQDKARLASASSYPWPKAALVTLPVSQFPCVGGKDRAPRRALFFLPRASIFTSSRVTTPLSAVCLPMMDTLPAALPIAVRAERQPRLRRDSLEGPRLACSHGSRRWRRRAPPDAQSTRSLSSPARECRWNLQPEQKCSGPSMQCRASLSSRADAHFLFFFSFSENRVGYPLSPVTPHGNFGSFRHGSSAVARLELSFSF